MLTYYSQRPSSGLRDLVNQFVVFEGILPSGFVWYQNLVPTMSEYIFFNLSDDPQPFVVQNEIIILKDSLLTGQYSTPFQAKLTERVKIIGVSIKTSGLSRLFDIPMKYLSNAVLSLRDMIGPKAECVFNNIKEKRTIVQSIEAVENFLFDRMASSSFQSSHPALLHSLQLINSSKGVKQIQELVRSTRMSEKTLQRIFLNEVGVTPKMFCRLHRFNEVLHYFNTHKKFTLDIVEHLGYYDQSHFIHDFKSFSGFSPVVYFKDHPGVKEFFSSL